MKKLYLYLTIALLIGTANAGLVTHSDYTSGTAITAAGQNTNENLIFNEFNGNVDNNNIKVGGVTDSNMAAHTLTGASISLTANVQISSITASSSSITNMGASSDASEACPTCIGFSISSTTTQSNAKSSTGSGQYFDIVSTAVPAGDWDVTGVGQCTAGGCTITVQQIGVSFTSGNSSTGLAPGTNLLGVPIANGSYDTGGSIPNYRVLHAASEQMYLKAFVTFSGVCTNPSCYGTLSARRRH